MYMRAQKSVALLILMGYYHPHLALSDGLLSDDILSDGPIWLCPMERG